MIANLGWNGYLTDKNSHILKRYGVFLYGFKCPNKFGLLIGILYSACLDLRQLIENKSETHNDH